jgi:alanine racemase
MSLCSSPRFRANSSTSDDKPHPSPPSNLHPFKLSNLPDDFPLYFDDLARYIEKNAGGIRRAFSGHGMDAKYSLGEPRCLISRSAILHNVALIRSKIGPGVKICAVVKADAYGHDADILVDTLCNFTNNDTEPPVVDALAVADIDEAAALPPTDLPIFVLRPVENAYMGTQRSRLEAATENGWILTLASPAAADDLNRIALARGQRAGVQIMVNTGMNRAGVDVADFAALAAKIAALPALKLIGVATHFASSDEPSNAFNAEQLKRFTTTTEAITQADRPTKILRSAANTGGVFFQPESILDMVRPGIGIYGIDPTCRPNMNRNFRPIMRWTAPLIHIRDVPAGSTVGYGQTWIASKPTRLGLIPIGYADGYPRTLSNKSVMMIHGHPAPVAGRVSMDLTVIDLSQIPNATLGDEVIVLDNDPLSPASVYQLAELTNTIPYEIFCRIGKRIRRVAVDDLTPVIRNRETHETSA